MGIFNFKEERPNGFRDPFDDKLIIDLPNGSATLGYCRNAIKGMIQETLSLLNDITSNPKFKDAGRLLDENIKIVKEENSLIVRRLLKNKELLEKQNQQIADNLTIITNIEKKNKEIAENQALYLVELNKKIEEIKNISVQAVFEEFKKKISDFEKEQEERYLKDLTTLQTKISSFIDNKINTTVEDTVKKIYEMADNKLNEAVFSKTKKDDTEDSVDDEEFTLPE